MMILPNTNDIFGAPSGLPEATPEQKLSEASASDFASLLAASYTPNTTPANIALTPEPIKVDEGIGIEVTAAKPNFSPALMVEQNAKAFADFAAFQSGAENSTTDAVNSAPASFEPTFGKDFSSLPAGLPLSVGESFSTNSPTKLADLSWQKIAREINADGTNNDSPALTNQSAPIAPDDAANNQFRNQNVSDVIEPTASKDNSTESIAATVLSVPVKSESTTTKILKTSSLNSDADLPEVATANDAKPSGETADNSTANEVLTTVAPSLTAPPQNTPTILAAPANLITHSFVNNTNIVAPANNLNQEIINTTPALAPSSETVTDFAPQNEAPSAPTQPVVADAPTVATTNFVNLVEANNEAPPSAPSIKSIAITPSTTREGAEIIPTTPPIHIEIAGATKQAHFENLRAFRQIQAEVKNVIVSLQSTDSSPIVAEGKNVIASLQGTDSSPIIAKAQPVPVSTSFVINDVIVSIPPESSKTINIKSDTFSPAPETTIAKQNPVADTQSAIASAAINFKQENGGSNQNAITPNNDAADEPLAATVKKTTAPFITTEYANQSHDTNLAAPSPTTDEQAEAESKNNIQIAPTLEVNAAQLPTEPTVKPINAPPVIHQTAEAIADISARLRPQEVQAVRLQLRPEKLGRVEIEIARDAAGQIHASLVTASQETQQILTQDIGQLRQALEQNGVPLARLDVLNSAQSQLPSQSQNQSQQQPQARPESTFNFDSEPSVPLTAKSTSQSEANKLVSLHA